MKSLILIAALFSANAMAANKVCFGSKQDSYTKDMVMVAEITAENVKLTTTKAGEFEYNGTYPNSGETLKGDDGVQYLDFLGEYVDVQDHILINESLLNSGTTGLLQIRGRGEGFYNYVFVCRDDNKANQPISFTDFKTQIVNDVEVVKTGERCTTDLKMERNKIEVTIRKGGRITSVLFTDRDQIKITQEGDLDYTRSYTTGDRNFLKFIHAEGASDQVVISLGGRETKCEVKY